VYLFLRRNETETEPSSDEPARRGYETWAESPGVSSPAS
jgi:hypothetical protein